MGSSPRRRESPFREKIQELTGGEKKSGTGKKKNRKRRRVFSVPIQSDLSYFGGKIDLEKKRPEKRENKKARE